MENEAASMGHVFVSVLSTVEVLPMGRCCLIDLKFQLGQPCSGEVHDPVQSLAQVERDIYGLHECNHASGYDIV